MPVTRGSAAARRARPSDGTAVRRWSMLCALLAGLLATHAAAADQKDPRLNGLFTRLQIAATADAAQPIEAAIWEIWSQSGDRDVDALMRVGVSALQASDYNRAIDVFSRVVTRAPEFAEGWNKRATALYLIGRSADSITDIDHVLKLEPRHFGALSGLGMCNAQLHRDQDALRAFERAAAIDPNLSGVRLTIDELKKRLSGQSI